VGLTVFEDTEHAISEDKVRQSDTIVIDVVSCDIPKYQEHATEIDVQGLLVYRALVRGKLKTITTKGLAGI
jgi:hypothetical protein